MLIRFLFFTLCSFNMIKGASQENGVYFLDDQNFAEFISKNQEVLVIFTNEWCIFCKQLYSEVVKLGLRTQRAEGQLKVAQIDTDSNQSTLNIYGVEEYPTILFFLGGESFKYQGHKNEQDIYLWTQRIVNSEDKELQLNQLRILYDMKLAVLFTYPKEHTSAFKKFKKLQLDNPNTPFFFSTNEEVKKKLELKNKFNLVVFKDFNGGDQDYLESDDQFTLDQMQNFVNQNTKISLNYLDEDFVNKVFVEKSSGLIVFTDGMDEKLNPEMIIYRDFTRKNLNKFNFAYAKWNRGMGNSLFKYLGLKEQEVPIGVIVDYKNGKLRKFKMPQITKENLQQSLSDYLQQKLTPYTLNKDVNRQNSDIEELNSHQLQNKVFDNNNRQTFVLIFDENTKNEIFSWFSETSRQFDEFNFYLYDGIANENDNIQIKRIPDVLFVNQNQKKYLNKEMHKYSIKEFVNKFAKKQVKQTKLSEEL